MHRNWFDCALVYGWLVAVGLISPVVRYVNPSNLRGARGALAIRLEVEILKEAVEWGRSKNLIARSPLLPGDDR